MTKNSSTIIAGDLHLLKKPGMWSGRSEIAGDDVFALEQLVEICGKDSDLMLLGDVFDTVTNLPRPIMAATKLLQGLATQKRLRFIQGQHEIVCQAHYENYPWLSLIDGAEHVGGKKFEFMGFKAYGMDYFPLAFESLEFAKAPKDIDILFMHGTIDTAMPMAFHFTADSLKQFTDLRMLFAGDYHQAIDLVVGDCTVMYTGSTWQISADEPRAKSVIKVTRSGDAITVERIPLKTRKIVKLSELFDAHFDMDLAPLKDIDKSLPKELQLPVILVDQPTPPELYEQLAQHGHLYTTSAANPDLPTRELVDKYGELSNAEILQGYVDKEKNPEQFAFTLDVIENSAEDAVKRLKDKLGIKDVDHTIPAAAPEINLDAAEEEDEEVVA